ncbi:UNVERIFIED_CONTAM: hypothetical protein GTU68_048775 [Idotea baltica]|nr:hypothetical protein [Idotea baltica]
MSEVLSALSAGHPVVVIDDEERENEADIVVAADKLNEDALAFMVREGRTVICLTLEAEQLSKLGVALQQGENTSAFSPNFAMSIDHASVSGRGEEVDARVITVAKAISDEACPSEFVSPGYIFPLSAATGGVLKRRGHTEASVDLARMAGCKPAAIICEVMDANGVMLCGAPVEDFCNKHSLKLTSVEAIAQYRLHNEVCISPAVIKAAEKSTAILRLVVYQDDYDDLEHMALVVGEPKDGALVRVHSECLTGDVFGSLRCDCGSQLDEALIQMLEIGQGVLVYLHQEGRGIGLSNKMRAYKLQDEGLDTVAANEQLGFRADQREYRAAAHMLSDLGLSSVKLLTNNPDKISSLNEFGVKVESRQVLKVGENKYNKAYLETKRSRMGHLLD